jgi:hypothetical protein
MKTSIKLALVIFGAAGVAAMPLAAFADDATPEGGNNCSNMRTTTHSRCVHYNEKAHDGYATQQSEKGFLKANPPTSISVNHPPPKFVTDGNGQKIDVSSDNVIIRGPGYSIINGIGFGSASVINSSSTNTKLGQGGSGGRHSSR